MMITCTTTPASLCVSEAEILGAISDNRHLIEAVQRGEEEMRPYLGWYDLDDTPLDLIEAEAARVRSLADVMIVIGIGGSNRAAMAAYESLSPKGEGIALHFSGDSLSERSLEEALTLVRQRSVVLNVIAKDFNTLEPGIAFRLLREALKEKYGSGYGQRIVATGSSGEGQLEELCAEHGWSFLPFPADVGGRFSAFTAVSLFPLAVAGIDVRAMVEGASSMLSALRSQDPLSNPAVRYAVLRSLVWDKGIRVEALALFEPALQKLGRWWTQLFAESEGKCDRALLPVTFSYSEDLHAVGQYVQQGPRIILETFLDLSYPTGGVMIEPSAVEDGFSYLDGMAFASLNRSVYSAALEAHRKEGVACIELGVDRGLDEESLAGLMAFFLFSAYLSSRLIEVHPFTQDGVELYKKNMYAVLKKPGYGMEQQR